MTVFGILHLVCAAYGIFSAGALLLQPILMSSLSKGNAQLEAQLKIQQSMQWYFYLCSGMAVFLAVILLIAGIKLLRGKRDALSWSNGYSYTSIVLKLVTVCLTLAFMGPLMRQQYADAKVYTPEIFLSNAWFAICGVVPMIYPFLAWLLLRRPQVKSWFANFGT